MRKHTLYPKTKRIGKKTNTVITEKLDGSNLCLYKEDGRLMVAQRNGIYPHHSRENGMLKGLAGWLDEYGERLQEDLMEGSCICCEWLGMGKIKYKKDFGKLHQFAKANVKEDRLANLNYDRELFKWCFVAQEVPYYIKVIPKVKESISATSVEELDKLYGEYCEEVGRSVEGFIIIANGGILKYVRHKDGKLQEEHYVG